MGFFPRFVGTNLDLLMDSFVFSQLQYAQLVGVRIRLGVAETGLFPDLCCASRLKPRVLSSESLAGLICFMV